MKFPKIIRGKFVKDWRKRHNLTREEAAGLIHLSLETWAKIEQSKRCMSRQEAGFFEAQLQKKERLAAWEKEIFTHAKDGIELALSPEQKKFWQKIYFYCEDYQKEIAKQKVKMEK